MKESGGLLPTLDRLFAGPRDSMLSLSAFLDGLETRSYAFAIAALNIPNIIPTGIPWLSTITGVPMCLLVVQYFLGRETPTLPAWLGRRSLPRGRLQDFLAKARRHIERLESNVHPRQGWWVSGLPRRLMLFFWALLIVILALPIPFDNLFPAWAIFFFCLALLENDGVMAMLGWLLTLITAAWTAFLLVVGPYVVITAVKSVFAYLFQ